MSTRLLSRLRRFLRRKARDEDGTATVPFVIIFPMFMMIVVSSLEMGIMTIRQVMLDRGLDLAVRNLRLGVWAAPTHNQVKQAICNGAGFLPDCMNTLVVELQTVSKTSWTMPPPRATCRDLSKPINTDLPPFSAGASDELLIIRACVQVKPMAPTTGLGMALQKDAYGNYALVSSSAFVNEPRLN